MTTEKKCPNCGWNQGPHWQWTGDCENKHGKVSGRWVCYECGLPESLWPWARALIKHNKEISDIADSLLEFVRGAVCGCDASVNWVCYSCHLRDLANKLSSMSKKGGDCHG